MMIMRSAAARAGKGWLSASGGVIGLVGLAIAKFVVGGRDVEQFAGAGEVLGAVRHWRRRP